ncbi:hypothetical protein [Micromonospora arborensis]|uniref:hypothetical protein n=1 Tax=Micromonospora arborensis TaxID=2116518 RepID=UPI00371BBBEA
MADALIRMRLAVLRRDLSGPRAVWMFSGAVAGTGLAIGTIGVATLAAERPDTVLDLLAVVFAAWTVGWMVGPAYGGQPVLRAEQFALQPVPRHRLAVGLLGAALVGPTSAVTLIAFTATLAFAVRYGSVPVLVAVPGVLLQLVLVVLLSRLTGRMFGALSRSRVGAAVSAVISAVMLVALSCGWIVFAAVDAVRATGIDSGFSAALRVLPSSWALVAVGAAARRDWLMVLLPLLALVALVALLWQAWCRSLSPARWSGPTVRGSAAMRAAPRGWASRGTTAAVLVKELRTWGRDSQRVHSLVLAPTFAVLTCLTPLVFGSTALLPFLGVVTVVMALVTSANLYAQDGTALWLTLLMPGSERSDVRGRQLAWLAVFAPMTLGLTVLGMAVGGDPGPPWVLAVTVALLGGGAGLLPVVALNQLVPGPDPRARKSTPLGRSDVVGQAFVMMFLALGASAPTVITVLLGQLLDEPMLRGAGLPVGALTAVLGYALLGRAAHRTLTRRGPELLYLLRTGTEQQARTAPTGAFLAGMPAHRRRLLWSSFFVGCIALFPQALVPLLMKLSGDAARLWFLALYVPPAWQWPTVTAMFAVGAASLTLAGRICLAHSRGAAVGATPGRQQPVEQP